MKRAVLLDVSAMMYRAYYSLINMRNTKGQASGAVYGFSNILSGLIKEFKPDYIAACFDVKRSSLERTKKYKEYKANRKAMPDDLVSQLDYLQKYIDAMNINSFKIEGHEADDVMGTLAKKLSKEGIEVLIITGDKDLSQLLEENIKIALLGKGTGASRFKIIETEEDVVEQLGVKSHQITNLFGLMGDTSDGIPGVRGIGAKTGAKLIEKYENLENLYDNIDDLKGKQKEKLIEDKELAFMSRELAEINYELDINYELENLKVEKPKEKELLELFIELEFKSLIKKFKLKTEAIETGEEVSEKIEFTVIKNKTELEELKKEKALSYYYNQSGISFSNGQKNFYVPLSHRYLGAFSIDLKEVENLLDSEIEFYAYNIKELLNKNYKINNYFDVMLAHYLLNPEKKQEIDDVVFSEFSINLETYKEVFLKKTPEETEINQMAEFSSKRAYYTFKLKELLEKELKEQELYDLFIDIEMKLIEVLSSMEKEGIKINVPYFSKYSIELNEKIENLKKEIYEIAEEEFNINSPKQLSEILFLSMNIDTKGVKKTKSSFSTNVDTLELLRDRGEKIAGKILDYRKYAKLFSTYVEALPKLADKNGRIHTSFNQDGTATGRLSSSNPNLQNIPAKTDEGMKIRKGFVAKDGYSILAIDYSQIELRILAEVSKDEHLIEAYKNDLDLHSLTASKIFEKDNFEDITRMERTIAKIVNFSIIYGKTSYGLSQEINISVSDAKEYIDKYFNEYKGVRNFIDKAIKEAEDKSYAKTLFGRKRKIIGIDSTNKMKRKHAERMAINTVIQGTAADILKIVMIKVQDEIKNETDIKMLLQVHDELIFEVKEESLEKYRISLKEIMENTIKLKDVDLKVNDNYGKNWSEAK